MLIILRWAISAPWGSSFYIPCDKTFPRTFKSDLLKKNILDYDFWIRWVTYCCYLQIVAAGEPCCLSDNSGYITRDPMVRFPLIALYNRFRLVSDYVYIIDVYSVKHYYNTSFRRLCSNVLNIDFCISRSIAILCRPTRFWILSEFDTHVSESGLFHNLTDKFLLPSYGSLVPIAYQYIRPHEVYRDGRNLEWKGWLCSFP